MGFFDKLFNSDSDEPNKEVIQQGYIRRFDKKITLPNYILDDNQEIFDIDMKDPSKAIDAIHWDGLTPEAQEALSQKGFYREGDDYEIIKIEP